MDIKLESLGSTRCRNKTPEFRRSTVSAKLSDNYCAYLNWNDHVAIGQKMQKRRRHFTVRQADIGMCLLYSVQEHPTLIRTSYT